MLQSSQIPHVMESCSEIFTHTFEGFICIIIRQMPHSQLQISADESGTQCLYKSTISENYSSYVQVGGPSRKLSFDKLYIFILIKRLTHPNAVFLNRIVQYTHAVCVLVSLPFIAQMFSKNRGVNSEVAVEKVMCKHLPIPIIKT